MTDFETRLRNLKQDAEDKRIDAESKKVLSQEQLKLRTDEMSRVFSEKFYGPIIQLAGSMEKVGISAAVSHLGEDREGNPTFRLTAVFGHIDFIKNVQSGKIHIHATPNLKTDETRFEDSDASRVIKYVEDWVETNAF